MKKTIQLLGCPMVPPFQETPIFDQLKRPRFGQRCWSGTSRPAPCLGSKKNGLNPTPKKTKKNTWKIIQLFDGYRDLMVINNQLISDILDYISWSWIWPFSLPIIRWQGRGDSPEFWMLGKLGHDVTTTWPSIYTSDPWEYPTGLWNARI